MKRQERFRELRSRIRCECGQAMVEFALCASVLFLLLVGVMKICLAVYTYHFVSEAARETVRYAVVHGSSASSPVSTNDQIQALARGLGYPGIKTASLTTTSNWNTYPTSGGSCSPSATCNNPGNIITVTVKYAFPFSVPFVNSRTLNMTSTSAMVIQY